MTLGYRVMPTIRRRLLLPVYWKYYKRSQVMEYHRELEIHQGYSPSRLQNVQAHKLTQLLQYATGNIPYYKTIAEKRQIKPNEDNVFDELKKFPFLTKDIIRAKRAELCNFYRDDYYLNTSGGSTGEPVLFYQDRYYSDWSSAAKLLFDSWAGRAIGEPKIKLWGSMRDIRRYGSGLRELMSSSLHGQVLLNSFRMSEQDMRRYVQKINAIRPSLILGYAESLDELARFIKDRDLTIWSPRSVMSSASVLYESTRHLLEEVFRCPVFDRYGSREVGDIACECPHHEGLHLLPDNHVVEIVSEDGLPVDAGETGEVVITLLTNYTMPLIRYRMGDLAKRGLSQGKCGTGFPILKSVQGRVTGVFYTRDGSTVDGHFFHYLMFFRDWVRKWKVVQEDYDMLEIMIVPSKQESAPTEGEKEEIRSDVRTVMGQDTQIVFSIVDDIPPSDSGKFRYTVSKVDVTNKVRRTWKPDEK